METLAVTSMATRQVYTGQVLYRNATRALVLFRDPDHIVVARRHTMNEPERFYAVPDATIMLDDGFDVEHFVYMFSIGT